MPWGSPSGDSRESLPTSPFTEENLAGYSLWKPYDTHGSWYSMLLPGNSGSGLHLGQLFDPECCTGYFPTRSATTCIVANNTPWLLPSSVRWHSIMDSDGKPLELFIKEFDVDYPCVAITEVDTSYSDFRWFLDNVNVEFETDRWDYEPTSLPLFIEGMPPILGIVPIWTVMPISLKYAGEINKSISNIRQQTSLDVLGECWCTIDHAMCDQDCSSYQGEYCNCNSQVDLQNLLEKTWSEPIDTTIHMTEICKEIYTEAVQNFYSGWQVIFNEMQKGEKWAYYWWQQQSPFLDSPGQSAKMTTEWTDLTSLETQQAS